MTTKLGVCNFCVPGTGVFAPRFVADVGLDGMSIEFGSLGKGFPLSSRRLQDAYLDAQQQFGIQYPNIGMSDFDNTPMHAAKGSPSHEVGRRMFRDAIDAAAHMKIPLVFAPSFSASDIRSDEEFDRTAEMLRFACDVAGERGVLVASENTLSTARQRHLVEAVDRKNFKLFYDSNNLFHFRGIDQVQALQDTYDLLVPQLHVKDGKKGEVGSALLGTGDSNFKGVMRELGRRKYDGWLIIENAYEQMPLRGVMENVFDIFRQDVTNLLDAAREAGMR
jgi:sugar phosphate isomerase/epimerase